MTREETAIVIKTIKGLFPKAYTNMSNDDIRDMVDVWAVALRDDDYKLICNAVVAFARSDTSGFPPNIGQLVDIIDRVKHSDEPTDSELVEIIIKASGHANGCAQAVFDSLPDICKIAVGSAQYIQDLAVMPDFDVHSSYTRNDLMKRIKVARERQRDCDTMPEGLRLAIQGKEGHEAIEASGDDWAVNLLGLKVVH